MSKKRNLKKKRIKTTEEQIRKQIGMAVPVKMAKIIITSILKTFANKAYKSINKSNYII